MNKEILNLIGDLNDFFFLDKPSAADVEKAESDLGVCFADDYKTYISVGGAICGGGIELTGITDFDRLNVVSVTRKERLANPLIPDNMYVVETVGIDRMVILQDEGGTIFTAQPGLRPEKLFDSLTEYIKNVGMFEKVDDEQSGFTYEYCDEFGQDLVERMQNGLIPILPDGTMVYLHHMGLSMNAPIDVAPIVEFESNYYENPQNTEILFNGFVGGESYDRVECIYQKQEHWYERSKADEIKFNI